MTRVPTMLRRRLLRPAAGLAAISAVVLSGAALSTTAGAARAEVVTLGQATATSLTFGPVFAAVELGYFEQEKIELRFLNFQGASVLLPQVANKSVMIGFPGPDPLIVSHQPGRDPMPVKFFYNAARSSIWEFLVLQDSPLKTLADLRGKVIGVGALANANVPITRAMLKDIGLGPNDYSFMAIGVGAPSETQDLPALSLYQTSEAVQAASLSRLAGSIANETMSTISRPRTKAPPSSILRILRGRPSERSWKVSRSSLNAIPSEPMKYQPPAEAEGLIRETEPPSRSAVSMT